MSKAITASSAAFRVKVVHGATFSIKCPLVASPSRQIRATAGQSSVALAVSGLRAGTLYT